MKSTRSRITIVFMLACALLWAGTLRLGDEHGRRDGDGQVDSPPDVAATAAHGPKVVRRTASRARTVPEEDEYVEPYGEEVSEQEQRARHRIAEQSASFLSNLEHRWRSEPANTGGQAAELGAQILAEVRDQQPAAATALQMECRSTLCRFRVPGALASTVMAPMDMIAAGQRAHFIVLRQGDALDALEVVMDVASDDFSGLGGI